MIKKTKAGIGSSLLSSAFEYIAHRILRNGGKFELDEYIDQNYDDQDAKVNLPRKNIPLFFNKSKIGEIQNNKYYQPREN